MKVLNKFSGRNFYFVTVIFIVFILKILDVIMTLQIYNYSLIGLSNKEPVMTLLKQRMHIYVLCTRCLKFGLFTLNRRLWPCYCKGFSYLQCHCDCILYCNIYSIALLGLNISFFATFTTEMLQKFLSYNEPHVFLQNNGQMKKNTIGLNFS